jgi:hypothetical protein
MSSPDFVPRTGLWRDEAEFAAWLGNLCLDPVEAERKPKE